MLSKPIRVSHQALKAGCLLTRSTIISRPTLLSAHVAPSRARAFHLPPLHSTSSSILTYQHQHQHQHQAAARGRRVATRYAIVQPGLRRFSSAVATAPASSSAAAVSAAAQAAWAQQQDAEFWTPNMKILYGSQTGTAKLFAHNLAKAAKKLKYNPTVVDLANYDPASLPNDGLVVLVMASFGHGEPTTNAAKFYDWLLSAERAKDAPLIQKTKFAVFGLGQSKQHPENYQAVARAVDQRLSELGGLRFMERGEGDDSKDVESDFDEWSSNLWERLDAIKEGGNPIVPFKSLPSALKTAAPTTPVASPASATAAAAAVAATPAAAEAPQAQRVFHSEVSMLRELHTPLSGRSCKHIEFSIKGGGLQYQPGDWVGVVPQNSPLEIARLSRRLGYRLHDKVDIAHFPLLLDIARTYHCESLNLCGMEGVNCDKPKQCDHTTCTTFDLETVLSQLCDVTAPPRRALLKFLADYATAPEETEKLKFLSSSIPMASADYNNWVVAGRMTLLEILDSFQSIRPGSVPLDVLLEQLSPLQPRFYSVACSPLVQPDSIHMTAAMVKYRSAQGFEHEGVCTSFLARQQVGKRVAIFVKPSVFKLPADPSTPIIMCGAGTGVAPFRSFIQHRLACQEGPSCVNPRPSEPNSLLFFGCNNRNHDYLYREELEKAEAKFRGAFQIIPAFSFENPWRVFVQHRMVEPANASRIWDFMARKNGILYVCGDSKTIAPGVLEAMTYIAQTEGKMSRSDAEQFVKKLQEERRYQLDVF